MWHTAFTHMTFSLPPATTPCVRIAEVSKYNPQFTDYACAQAVMLIESLLCWNLDPNVMHWACIKELCCFFFFIPPPPFPQQETTAVSCSQSLHPFDYRGRYVILHQQQSVQWALVFRNHLCHQQRFSRGHPNYYELESWFLLCRTG